VITSDAGLLAYRELDTALALTDMAGDALADARTGKSGRHLLVGLLRQSVFGRLAGYEDVNDAERLCRDPAMRWVVGDRGIGGTAASASQMGRFETEWLTRPANLVALAWGRQIAGGVRLDERKAASFSAIAQAISPFCRLPRRSCSNFLARQAPTADRGLDLPVIRECQVRSLACMFARLRFDKRGPYRGAFSHE
jgi:hypothetical protein